MKFIASSLVSSRQLIKLIASYCIMFGRNSSVLSTYALLCCARYNRSLSELVSNPEQIKYFSFYCWHLNNLSDTQKITAGSLLELLTIRDGQLFLPQMFFTCQQFNDIIEYLCTSGQFMFFFFWSYVHFCHVTIRLFVCFLYWIYVFIVRINVIIIIIMIWWWTWQSFRLAKYTAWDTVKSKALWPCRLLLGVRPKCDRFPIQLLVRSNNNQCII